MKFAFKIDKIYSENFYYWHLTNEFATAKVYFWFFENKVTLEDFQVFQKRKNYGTKTFKYILQFLKKEGIDSFFLSSRNTKEAQSFWHKLTGHTYNSRNYDHTVSTNETLSRLNLVGNHI